LFVAPNSSPLTTSKSSCHHSNRAYRSLLDLCCLWKETFACALWATARITCPVGMRRFKLAHPAQAKPRSKRIMLHELQHVPAYLHMLFWLRSSPGAGAMRCELQSLVTCRRRPSRSALTFNGYNLASTMSIAREVVQRADSFDTIIYESIAIDVRYAWRAMEKTLPTLLPQLTNS
jgi:hypothetical protein